MAYKDRGRWKVTWRTKDGKRCYKTFPEGSSEKIVKEFEIKLRFGFIPEDFRSCPTVAEYSKRFLEVYPTVKRRAESTIIKDHSTFDHHVIPAFGDIRLNQIKPGDLLTYQSDLFNGFDYCPQTIKNIMSILSSMFKLAVIEGIIEYNPCSCVPRIESEKGVIPKFWTFKETDQFLCYCVEHDYELFQLVAFAVNTGLRPGELQALKRDCLNFHEAYVDVRRNYCTKTNKINEWTKTRVNRRISVPPAILKVISNKISLAQDDLIFPLQFNSLGFRRIRPMSVDAGVKPIRFHDLRHTFASHLVMRGRPLIEVRDLLGHRSIKSTEIYAHLTEEFKKGATNCLTQGMRYVQSQDVKVINLY